MNKWVQIDGRYKLSANYLKTFPVLNFDEPHELRLVEGDRRWWTGGYFENGEFIENIVTVDLFDKKKKDWVQVDQYKG